MDKRKSKIILGVLLSIIIVAAAAEMVLNWRVIKGFFEVPNAHAEQVVNFEDVELEAVSDRIVPKELWESDGYTEFSTWVTDLKQLKADSVGITEAALEEWGQYLDDEEKARLQAIEDEIQTLTSITQINALLEEFNGIIEENKPAPEPEPKPVASSSQGSGGSSNYSGGSSGSFKQMGVVYDNNYRYTWYSQNVLPGGGLNIPGRHVNGQNFVCDENGYIVVAADPSTLAYGSVIETPFGTAKVYDTGCAPGTIDIYTNY